MIRLLAFGMVMVVLHGCASVHSGRYAEQVGEEDQSLVVSAKLNSMMSGDYFGMLEFTFENRSEEWVHIKEVRIEPEMSKGQEYVTVLAGEKLNQWYNSTMARNAISQHNAAIGAGLLMGVGAVAAGRGNNSTTQVAGKVLATAALGSLTLQSLNKTLDRIEGAQIFPHSHIYHGETYVPPGLFVRKWLVLNTRQHDKMDDFYRVKIIATMEDGEVKRYIAKFKQGGEWSRKNTSFSWYETR